MQKRTVSLRTFLVVVGILALALIFGMAGWGRLQIESATVEATTPRSQTQEIAFITQEETPDHPSQELLSRIYEDTTQSVVNIQVRRQEASGASALPQPQGGEGSGWVWDDDGHVITNNHVVEDATDIIVNFANGMWAEAELVARDPQSDLAVIRVDPPEGVDLRPLERAAGPPKVGHYTIALGSPFGLENSMSLGIVSALGRSFPVGDPRLGARYSLPEVIQTDAAMNPGNSGGPLLNLNGRVVGINFAIRTMDRSDAGVGFNSGVGFAIPISVANRVIPALISDGAYRYPYLGISGATITALVAEQQNLPANRLGVFVSRVVGGGPSAAAGLRSGDIIVSIDGVEMRSFEDVITYLVMEKSPGETVEIGILRNNILRNRSSRTVEVELASRPDAEEVDPIQQVVTGRDAIAISAAAVADANAIQDVDNSSARIAIRGGARVWLVTLEGEGKTATVAVDASSGEVLSLEVEGGN